MSLPDYDEDQAIGNYICGHFGSFMTEFEHKVEIAFLMASKVDQMKPGVSVRVELERVISQAIEAEVTSAIGVGITAFRLDVAKRILDHHRVEVFINRCPDCDRVVRTPRAQQCFWCGHSWHDVSHADDSAS